MGRKSKAALKIKRAQKKAKERAAATTTPAAAATNADANNVPAPAATMQNDNIGDSQNNNEGVNLLVAPTNLAGTNDHAASTHSAANNTSDNAQNDIFTFGVGTPTDEKYKFQLLHICKYQLFFRF
jgi:hypothetical protein